MKNKFKYYFGAENIDAFLIVPTPFWYPHRKQIGFAWLRFAIYFSWRNLVKTDLLEESTTLRHYSGMACLYLVICLIVILLCHLLNVPDHASGVYGGTVAVSAIYIYSETKRNNDL